MAMEVRSYSCLFLAPRTYDRGLHCLSRNSHLNSIPNIRRTSAIFRQQEPVPLYSGLSYLLFGAKFPLTCSCTRNSSPVEIIKRALIAYVYIPFSCTRII